jgi:hypothetical protein
VADQQNQAIGVLAGIPCIADAQVEDGEILATYVGEDGGYHVVVDALVKQGLKVLCFAQAEIDLEDVFLKVTRGVVS